MWGILLLAFSVLSPWITPTIAAKFSLSIQMFASSSALLNPLLGSRI
jgi:hypothetical protein